jgi:hypothetical protein
MSEIEKFRHTDAISWHCRQLDSRTLSEKNILYDLFTTQALS